MELKGIRFDETQMRLRGFEVVSDKFRKFPEVEIVLPQRADKGSAGYDFRTPVEVTIKAGERVIIPTDIKAYMQEDEVLELYVRSSIGIKKGLVLSNGTGIIDSSFYGDGITREGNISIPLFNTTDKDVTLEAGERICQGIFKKYLIVDNDECIHESRTGGIGSSGVK